jgi:hypothetical protein
MGEEERHSMAVNDGVPLAHKARYLRHPPAQWGYLAKAPPQQHASHCTCFPFVTIERLETRQVVESDSLENSNKSLDIS